MKALYLKHGLKIMLVGFGLSAAGILLYIKMQYGNPVHRKIGFILVTAGLCLYIIGRVGVALARHAARLEAKKRRAASEEEDDSQ